MPRNGAGTYTLPAGSLVTDNVDDILASQHNTPLSDLASDANTARPVVAGGTGATTASGARTALGLVIGTDVQAYDAGLASIAGLTTAADKMIYTTALDTYAVADLSAYGRSVVAVANEAAFKALVNLEVGTDVQAYDADLSAIAALADPNADRILFWDDSAGAYAYLTAGSGLEISGTTIALSNGTVGPTATTSGTEVDFAVPSTANKIIIQFDAVSLSGTDDLLVQLGDAGGIETTGYVSSSGAGGTAVSSTSGLVLFVGAAARVVAGEMTLSRVGSSDRWISSHACGVSTTTTVMGGGSKTLSAAITTVRVTRTGTNTLDGGAVSIRYEV